MPTLKYEQIAESLRARISGGEFEPGDVLPSGRDLSEQWSVSRATVIKAMDVLRQEGLVIAHQGTGFRVAETSGAQGVGRRPSHPLRTAVGGPFRRLGVPEERHPPLLVARALGLGPGEGGMRRRRLMLSKDGEPGSLVSEWFHVEVADACPRLLRKALIAEGAARYVSKVVGRPVAEGRDVMSARLAKDEEAEALGLESPAVVVVELHSEHDADGYVLLCEERVTPAELWVCARSYPLE